MTEVKEPTLLDRLEEQRTRKHEEWAEFINHRETERAAFEQRTDSDEFKALPEDARTAEIQGFRAAEDAFKTGSERHRTELEELDVRVDDQREIHRRREEAAQSQRGRVEITSEPLTYRADNAHQRSYWQDLAVVHGPGISLQTASTRDQAQARLVRHAQELEVEQPKRAKAREKQALEMVRQAETDFLMRNRRNRNVDRLLDEMRASGTVTFNPFEKRVAPNLTDGQGGYFSPPIWLIDEYIPGLRAHRVLANLPRQMPLPPGVSQINVPKLATLTAVGYQQQNNSALPSQDFTDTVVTANVKTIGGFADVAIQLLELSPGNIVDEVITTDLMAAHDKFLDAEIIAGDANAAATLNGGHLTGLYPYTNWSANNITYTDGSPSGQHFISCLAVMASQVARHRFDIQNYATVLHGRRWFWYASSLDTNGRPLGETQAGGPFNAAATLPDGLEAEGLVGRLPYLGNSPVYIDNNMPTTDNTDGGGATRDIAISGNWNDAWLFEDALRTDIFREILSATLGVRFRVYGYKAFLARYGESFSVATGTGFTPPQGAVTSLLF